MGARTDFVKAMVLGIVIGVATTTAFFQLRTTTCPPAAGSAAQPPAKKITIEPVDPIAAPSPRTAQLVEQLGKAGITIDASQVTCDARCCKLAVDDATYDEHAAAIKATLEAMPGTSWQATKAGTVRLVEKCW